MTKLKQFIDANGITTYAMCKACDFHETTLYEMVRGNRPNLYLKSAKKIQAGLTKMLGRPVSLDEIF